METKESILRAALKLYVEQGEMSMRHLAKASSISLSVLYYYFSSKEELLQEMFDTTRKGLGKERAKLPQAKDASAMLRQRIEFQLEHGLEIVAILKYYVTNRDRFEKNKFGYIPVKAYRHIEEVLEYAKEHDEWEIEDLEADAKVITHAINGFVLEYYPKVPKGMEKATLVETIHSFLLRALKK